MSLKLLLAISLLVVISGCTIKDNKENLEEVNKMQSIIVSTEAFKEGGNIPVEYTCDGSDVSPALSWSGIPEGTKSIALIMDDPDAPAGTWVHWVLFNIPPGTQKLPGAVPGNETLSDGSRHGMTDFGRVGYGGPCPPSGTHRYYFRIYALDTKLDLPPGTGRKQVDGAMKGHILAKGELMGRYRR
ncbi:MAG: YbhB/YbcL family Raf kinase inhibitor-like protein [Candidatus Methanoperedens sp.]|nr:YbhB/YbcL family Raf kinase inhibitor-like protein [Candidatus Methanoperedens sp.]